MIKQLSHCYQNAADMGKAPDALTASPLPEHGSCFVCGTEDAKGMGVVWCMYEASSSQDEKSLPPGALHIFSEFEFDYRLPVPLHTPLRTEAELQKSVGRIAYAIGRIPVGDRVAVEATGLYIHIPTFFDDDKQVPDPTE